MSQCHKDFSHSDLLFVPKKGFQDVDLVAKF